MAIDHEEHKIRIKAVSDRMGHPMTYNDAGAPKLPYEEKYSLALKKNPKALEKARKGKGNWNAKEDAKMLDKGIDRIIKSR